MRWTEEKIERLGKLYESGLEYAEIGQRMGVTKYAVKAALKRHGIFEQYGRRKVIKRPKKKSAPKPEKQYNPNPITDSTRSLICSSYARKETIEAIARDISRPAEQVRKVLVDCVFSGKYFKCKR